ncbi:methyltransferase domain-containing protein [Amycolatopsis magusensis]|uniref:methyltransferase domain-containing protein n=1 Tax=Amycolatopsis magusensis TaxID=882444 RepID=UPI0024A957D8|nr:methyltransferase domain-containing protein [Amycolatopsis magusensis]MDI5976592.1 methyltransferase domain-containing protein [Amycolatopsis magusensis]
MIERLVAMMDGFDREPGAALARHRSHELLRLAPGGRVVDVGCGTGTSVGELTAAGAVVSGVDVNPEVLVVAKERHPGGEFTEGSAQALPFPDGHFHGYRAERVYHAVADPVAALAEAARVLAPGGRIVLIGPNWEMLGLDSTDVETGRAVLMAQVASMPSPRSALLQRNLLLEAGFTEVEAEVHTAVLTGATGLPMLESAAAAAVGTGVVSAERAENWLTDQRARVERGRFFLAAPQFVVSGTRPAVG